VSEVFEGVVSQRASNRAKTFAESEGLQVRQEDLDGGIVIYRTETRENLHFSDVTDRLAIRIGEDVGVAVVVRYDSRIGHRSSVVYRVGQPAEHYGPDEELFVPLDDEGEPQTDVKPIPASKLDPDEEYETSVNAIELGLRAIGALPWETLRRFIASR